MPQPNPPANPPADTPLESIVEHFDLNGHKFTVDVFEASLALTRIDRQHNQEDDESRWQKIALWIDRKAGINSAEGGCTYSQALAFYQRISKLANQAAGEDAEMARPFAGSPTGMESTPEPSTPENGQPGSPTLSAVTPSAA